jgi:hypothetical protein
MGLSRPFWQNLKPETVIRLINYWPPYLGAGIKVESLSKDKTTITVSMQLKYFNTNYLGVHFGGSLYSMCDPFFVFLLSMHLGKNFIIWDKAASINFIKPGKGRVKVDFHIPKDEIQRIHQLAESGEKVLPEFEATIVDEENNTVARVKKTLYVKKKKMS